MSDEPRAADEDGLPARDRSGSDASETDDADSAGAVEDESVEHEPVEDEPVGPARGRRRRRRHGGRWLVAAIVLVLLVGAAWLAVTAVLAKHDLNEARAQLTAARRDIVAGSPATARGHVSVARSRAHQAHRLTTGPAWALSAHLPVLGAAVTSVRGVTAGLDEVGRDVLPPLVDAASGIDPKTLLQPGGRIDVAAIQRVEPSLSRAATTTADVRKQLSLLPDSTAIGTVDRGRAQVVVELASLQRTLDAASLAAKAVPPLLGANGTQRYFVGLLNTAESRGVGGLPGAFVILVADHGKLSITHYESDNRLDHVGSGVDLGAQYDANYSQSQPQNTYINSTISPHFPYAAQIWAGMWQRASGEKVNGAIALDPTALSYLLRVTGPARTPSGQAVTAGNVVALTEQVAYARYPDVEARKQFLLEVARAADEQVITGQGNPTALLKAFGRAAGERRLLLWTSNPLVEGALSGLPLSGVLPDAPTAFAAPIVINAAGGKLDYYLQRTFRWSATGCGPTRTVTASVTLRNAAPSGPLPAYVTTRLDNRRATAKPGDNRVLLRYYATTGAKLTGATVNSRTVGVFPQTERNHPVYVLDLELPRGQNVSVVLTLTEPATGTPTIWTQPLVRPMQTTVSLPSCR